MRLIQCVPVLRALVTCVAVLALAACDDDPSRSPEAITPSPTQPVNLAAWVESLPEGEPPDVPYAVGMTLHLPDEVEVPVDGEDLEIIGATPRGTMLNVEWAGYVWVTPDGRSRVLADSLTHGVQDAVVSPDGRLFARGGDVVEVATGEVVAEIPDEATIVTGWVRDGLVYGTRDQRVHVWWPGEIDYGYDRWVWFPGHTQVGIETRRGCWRVIHRYSYDDQVSWPRQCRRPNPLTVSPQGTRVLTRDLAVRDAFGKRRGYLAGGPVNVTAAIATYWLTDRELLLALPTALLRCHVRTLDCERVVEGEVELPLR